MNAALIALRGARFYWRTHLGVVLGSALGAMVLIGALLVGDSVKATLRHQALLRVGKADAALVSGDRFFRQQLADEINHSAPALLLRGSVSRADGSARINQAQVLGVDDVFWQLAPSPGVHLKGEELALNERAAAQLGVRAGDTVILRVEKPGAFSRDAPLSGEESEVIAIRVQVARIIGDKEFGRFSLSGSQVPPFSIFVPIEFLQAKLEFAGKANLLLARGSSKALAEAVKAKWTIQDAALELRELPHGGGTELRTPRVFLDAPVVRAAPAGLDSLTYLVNELRFGEKAAPYSMVTAIDVASSGFLPAELADDQVVISQWLAEDLGVKLHERITLKYYVMGERRQLEEKAREFEIVGILPMSEPNLNSTWMPEFPGLSDQENCRDWQPGFAIDTTKIRDQDEKYWDDLRGTPKAFVNIAVGQEMWGNRWGDLSSIRYPAGTASSAIAEQLRANLSPEQVGLQVLPLREQALAATDAPVDFGELFVSFSFFLIAAAAVLTGLLFVFTLEQRNAEAGTLLALGLPPRLVRRMLLGEGALLALVGAGLGLCGAFVFTSLVLRALSTVWRGAVGAVTFQFNAAPGSLIGGAIGSVAVALLAMWVASRRQLRRSATELLSGEMEGAEHRGGAEPRAANAAVRRRTSPLPQVPLIVAAGSLAVFGVVGCLALAALLLVFSQEATAFFGAGAFLLISGLGVSLIWLRRTARASSSVESLGALGVRNAARRRGRSLATIAVLASGVFMVVAVDSFRQRPAATGRDNPGTGGFALVGESALPIYEDLNTPAGREAYGLEEEAMREVRIVPMRVREGDDASCLNLNRALQPRLLGVKPSELAQRGAFRFSDGGYFAGGEPESKLPLTAQFWWPRLDGGDLEDAVPGIVDANTLRWALQMKLGDTLEYKNERGEPFRVRFVATVSGSILQGSVLISEDHFVAQFPGSGGYRFFLIDAPGEQAHKVQTALSRALEDRGLELTPAARRLAEFQAVENTYLSIFQVLGGLGLLLGSAGLAIVVARNVLERRREFGLLEAVGFRPSQLRSMVFAEHRWLIATALIIGIVSALVAVWPGLAAKSGSFPIRELALLIVALAFGCVFWTWAATRLALRGSAIAALRAE